MLLEYELKASLWFLLLVCCYTLLHRSRVGSSMPHEVATLPLISQSCLVLPVATDIGSFWFEGVALATSSPHDYGATLGRGVNRSVATFVAGGLAVGAHRISSFCGETTEPLVLGLFVFLFAAVVTFMRFFPKMKARYDYGLLIFILTFCLVCVSGYRDDEVLDQANVRLSTILIGGATAVIICCCICPVWAGDDLHDLVAVNIEKLGNFLEGFGGEYFKTGDEESKDEDKSFLKRYKDVLNSKSTEESLANYAKWEPRHKRFRYRHPWEQYLKIGAITRQKTLPNATFSLSQKNFTNL